MPERIPVTTSSNCYVVHNIVKFSFENRVTSPLRLEKGARNRIVQVGVAASISSRVGLLLDTLWLEKGAKNGKRSFSLAGR